MRSNLYFVQVISKPIKSVVYVLGHHLGLQPFGTAKTARMILNDSIFSAHCT